jgi:hypothetical protein
MQMAYDRILSVCVDADTAAKAGGFERYRYECACCGEEVHICAIGSIHQVAHFRHQSGNNNVECENYIGNRSAVRSTGSIKNTQDRIEFSFSSSTKLFSVNVTFTADELSKYEQSGACFQVRTASDRQPFISIPIDNKMFLPDVSTSIFINTFGWKYCISFPNDENPRWYEVFRKDSQGYLFPSIFKIQTEDDTGNYRAKLIRSETLYTNTPYLIVFPHNFQKYQFGDGVVVGDIIKFKTMDRDFVATPVAFTQKSVRTERQLAKWSYTLEVNETVTLLWPPSPQVDESTSICADSAIIYSSFKLLAYGNTNAHPSDICKVDENLFKISISEITKIYKRNVEMILSKKENTVSGYQDVVVTEIVSSEYTAHDEDAYLFNRSGVVRLSEGTTLPMTASTIVRHYSFGYLDCIVKAPKARDGLIGKALIEDILKSYHRVEQFVWSDFDLFDLNEDVFRYLETCERTGKINSAVKRFIEEGRI